MTNKRGVCLVRFDDKIGPYCAYAKNIGEEFQSKVAMKSHLSTLSLVAGKVETEKDFFNSIIPFPDENFIAYSTYFYIPDESARGGNRALGIVLLVEQSQQMVFYKFLPKISAKMKKIANKIRENKNPEKVITKEIRRYLNKLLEIEKLQMDYNDSTGSLDLVKERISSEKPTETLVTEESMPLIDQEVSFDFLFEKMPTCLESIVYTLLSNDRVLVVGRQDEILITLSTLKEFLPHKKVYNDPWMAPIADALILYSKTAEDTKLHILGIREESIYSDLSYDERERSQQTLRYSSIDFEEFLYSFPITSKLVVDFYQGVVYGGFKNQFCKELLELIKKSDFDDAKQIIKTEINYLLENTNKIRDIFLNEENLVENFQRFLRETKKGELPLLMKMIEDINPQLHNRIATFINQNQLQIDEEE